MDNPETLVTLMGTQKMMTTNRTKKTNTENWKRWATWTNQKPRNSLL